jgi:FtsP/CotA-like multicopper oxidase with cupredoxin domain
MLSDAPPAPWLTRVALPLPETLCCLSPRHSQQRRAPQWEHLGVMGPLIRGAVGDTLKVVFRNRLSDNTVSMHPHGVWYDKDSEGSPYADGAPGEGPAGGCRGRQTAAL